MIRAIERYRALHVQHKTLKLYALVDGYQYQQQTGERLLHAVGINRPIFVGMQDEPLAHAGPWLIDITEAQGQVEQLEALEQAMPSVSWIITSVDLEGLSQLLQLKLDVQLPDGRTALLRFYDPRVLGNLYRTMDSQQRAEFFYLIDEWHFIYNGQRVAAGSRSA